MADVPVAFFSYSREDSEFALRLAADLKAAGAAVWIDQLDIGPGQLWDRAVQNALESCPSVLIILSPASVNSDNVMDEISFALDQKKTLIPVLYRDCDIPFRLRRFQHLDFRTEYERMLQELRKCLHIGGLPQAGTPAGATVATHPPTPAATITAETRSATPQPPAKDRPVAPVERGSSSAVREQQSSGGSFPAWAKIALPIAVVVVAVAVFLMMRSSDHSDRGRNLQGEHGVAGGDVGNARGGTAEITGTAFAHEQTSPPCSLPATSDAAFTVNDSQAWFFFAYRGGEATDQWTLDWLGPKGRVYKTDTVAHPVAGVGRFCFAMKIAGTQAQNVPGEWSVRVNRNGAEMAKREFQISR